MAYYWPFERHMDFELYEVWNRMLIAFFSFIIRLARNYIFLS